MRRQLRRRVRLIRRRIRRFERREIRVIRRWLEETENLLHLSVLIFVPLLVGLVTMLANVFDEISFLLFPPLAAGAYMLFANPDGKYASPVRFVAGLTIGAFSGWFAFEFASRVLYHVPPEQFRVHVGAAVLSIFLTGVLVWVLDVEEPAAFSTALLVLVTDTATVVEVWGLTLSSKFSFMLSVAISSSIVAIVFVLWRRQFYERRAAILYQTTHGDDHVLVPFRGGQAGPVSMFAAQIAAAHTAGKVVLLALVNDEPVAPNAEPDSTDEPLSDPAEPAATRLEDQADRIKTVVGVPCEIAVVAVQRDAAQTVLQVARETDCDLIVTPYEPRAGRLSPFVSRLFDSSLDVIAVRLTGERTRWKRILVPVRHAGEVAHAMLDFAARLAGRTGRVAACHCIDRERERRDAESMLVTLVEAFEGHFETRVSHDRIEDFLAVHAVNYDLVIVGSSTDRTAASRFISPPTFLRLQELDSDLAIVHRG